MNEFETKLNKLLSFLVDNKNVSLEEAQDMYTYIYNQYLKNADGTDNSSFTKFTLSSDNELSALKLAISLQGYVESPLLKTLTLDLAYDVSTNAPEL